MPLGVHLMSLNEMILSSISAGFIVIFAAGYAVFYTLSQIKENQRFLYLGYMCFGCLIISTIFLINLLNLSGRWEVIMLVMLLGYWAIPKMIWYLSVEVNNKIIGKEENKNK